MRKHVGLVHHQAVETLGITTEAFCLVILCDGAPALAVCMRITVNIYSAGQWHMHVAISASKACCHQATRPQMVVF